MSKKTLPPLKIPSSSSAASSPSPSAVEADLLGVASETPRPRYWKDEKHRTELLRLIPILSFALILPLALAHSYSTLFFEDSSTTDLLLLVGFISIFGTALALASRFFNGEWLIAIMWCVGFTTEAVSLGMNDRTRAGNHYQEQLVKDSAIFLFCAMALGVLSAAICKIKDILDCRYRRDYNLSERLYLIAPMTIGIYTSHVLFSPDRKLALINVFASIFYVLALLGYGLLFIKVAKPFFHGTKDVLDLIRVTANLSFGKVVIAGGGFSVLFFFLFLPTWRNLSARFPHTMMATLSLICEVTIYDLTLVRSKYDEE